jgi:polar amino acid transport system ATP-binding protein
MRPSDEIVIEVTDICKSYGNQAVLHNLSLTVRRGDILALIGPSGSGKSTLLRCLNLLERPESGRICVCGVGIELGYGKRVSRSDVSALRSNTGMVFQHFDLFPHLTALGNVIEAPITVLKMSRKEAIERAMELLDQVGLADRVQHFPHELSGGQKQRVAIARALAMDPSILLLDEITSALDPELVGEVLQAVRRLAASGMTMVLVTHEIAFARDVAKNVGFMSEGKLVVLDTTEKVLRQPSNPRLRAFLERYYEAGRQPV